MACSGALRILVVDDDVLLRELVSARLRAAAYVVIEAGNGEEALAALLDGLHTDILVTDIAMPNSISGWCLADRLRTLHPATPIIYTSSGAPDPARMLGNSRFLQKPYHLDDLIIAIQTMTSLQRGQEPRVTGVSDTIT